jgi:diguanylate cyclase (GGDEF)-like protein
MSNNEQKNTRLEIEKETASLRIRFLVPIVAMIVIILIVLALSLFYFQSESQSFSIVGDRLTRTQATSEDFYEKNVQNDVNALTSIIEAIKRDQSLEKLFKTYDRDALYEYNKVFFRELKSNYNITHFYFQKPDRVNLLRVHAPDRFGDKINRTTTLRAETNQATAYGIELGVLGTLTLRVVSPWFDSDSRKLIGYLELGMEIDHVIERLRDVFAVNVSVVIFKKYLDREKWVSGMRALGRQVDWERFKSIVVVGDARSMPAVVESHLMKNNHDHNEKVIHIQKDDHSYWILLIPITDVHGNHVGNAILLTDATFEMDATQRTVITVGISVMIVGALLIVFFYSLSKRVGDRLKRDEARLRELATHDELTGLCTRRVFNQDLSNEIERANRFGHQVSLLMLDIDFFKKVNDTYGHQAGDEVLKELGKRLMEEMRRVDYCCRYGGEEFALILPETDSDTAMLVAERVLRMVSGLPVILGDRTSIPVTVSIGVATYPVHARSFTMLVSSADSALYSAKQNGRNQARTA